jgi:hypothetical protein
MFKDFGKNMEVKITDYHNIGDSINKNISKSNGPKGFVEIFELDENKNKQLVGKSNLVTYGGREWLLSRALNYDNGSITPLRTEFISWFGLGTGGVVEIDPFDPISPANSNSDLSVPIMINASDSTCGDLRVSPAGYFKHPFDSIIYEEDNENMDRFLIAKITATIGPEDANNNLLSEAGLFTANSGSGGYSGAFNLYARVTFPSIMKYSTRTLVFVWYLYM